MCRGTAYHEAAHVIAIKDNNCQVRQVCVNEDESGFAEAEQLPSNASDIVLIALVGMTAEYDLGSISQSLEGFISAYVTAAGDRELITRFSHEWTTHFDSRSLWRQGQYNRATLFCQRHESDIRTLAHAILAKEGFPKCLDSSEIESALVRGPWVLVDRSHQHPDSRQQLFRSPDGTSTVNISDAQSFDSRAEAESAAYESPENWALSRLSDHLNQR